MCAGNFLSNPAAIQRASLDPSHQDAETDICVEEVLGEDVTI